MTYMLIIIITFGLPGLNFFNVNKCKVMFNVDVVLCDCSSRGRTNIPKECPPNTTDVNLSFNSLRTMQNNSFINLPRLRLLNIANCQISHIEKEAFAHLKRLRRLNMFSNPVYQFKWNVFKPLTSLQSLSISYSLLLTYPEDSWTDLSDIIHLSTNDRLNGSQFGRVVGSMNQMTNFVHGKYVCYLRSLKNNTFKYFENISLTTLQIDQECRIGSVDRNTFIPLKNLSILIISMQTVTRISDIFPALHAFRDRHMDLIDFSGSFRSYYGGKAPVLRTSFISYLGNICVKSINLGNNYIRKIEAKGFWQFKYRSCLQCLYLNHNKLDGSNKFFLFNNIRLFNNLMMLDLSRITGHVPFRLPIQLYNVTIPIPQSLLLLNFSNNIMKTATPQSMTFTGARNLHVIDLARTSVFPDCNFTINGLQNVRSFNASGSKCSKLSYYLLHSFKNLEELVLKSSSLGVGLLGDENGLFLRGLTSLKHIDISNNQFVASFKNTMFRSQFSSLLSLKLENNFFESVPVRLTDFRNILFIDLRNNKIIFLTKDEMNNIETLNKQLNKTKFTILLDGNPFACNCESLEFIKWTFMTAVKLDKNGNYSCLSVDGSYKTTHQVYSDIKNLKTHCASKMWLTFSVTISVFLILAVITSSLAYRYRISLQYFCLVVRGVYRHYHRLDGNSKEYVYDAFVAYNQKDYRWVCGPLRTFLEVEKGLKLSLHHRDFTPSEYIADNIMDAIKLSRKIIIVISFSFLDSEWGKYELDMARMQMFQQNREMLIVILLDDIPSSKMPKRLQQIWEKITCLEVDDCVRHQSYSDGSINFWKRLYEAVNL